MGGFLVHTEIYTSEKSQDYDILVILGRIFLAIMGTIVDLPNKRVVISNIDKEVFYNGIHTQRATKHASYITIANVKKLALERARVLDDKNEVYEVLNGN